MVLINGSEQLSDIRHRPMQAADLAWVWRIQANPVRQFLENPDSPPLSSEVEWFERWKSSVNCFMLEHAGQNIGYFMLSAMDSNRVLHLPYVHPDYRDDHCYDQVLRQIQKTAEASLGMWVADSLRDWHRHLTRNHWKATTETAAYEYDEISVRFKCWVSPDLYNVLN